MSERYGYVGSLNEKKIWYNRASAVVAGFAVGTALFAPCIGVPAGIVAGLLLVAGKEAKSQNRVEALG